MLQRIREWLRKKHNLLGACLIVFGIPAIIVGFLMPGTESIMVVAVGAIAVAGGFDVLLKCEQISA